MHPLIAIGNAVYSYQVLSDVTLAMNAIEEINQASTARAPDMSAPPRQSLSAHLIPQQGQYSRSFAEQASACGN